GLRRESVPRLAPVPRLVPAPRAGAAPPAQAGPARPGNRASGRAGLATLFDRHAWGGRRARPDDLPDHGRPPVRPRRRRRGRGGQSAREGARYAAKAEVRPAAALRPASLRALPPRPPAAHDLRERRPGLPDDLEGDGEQSRAPQGTLIHLNIAEVWR